MLESSANRPLDIWRQVLYADALHPSSRRYHQPIREPWDDDHMVRSCLEDHCFGLATRLIVAICIHQPSHEHCLLNIWEAFWRAGFSAGSHKGLARGFGRHTFSRSLRLW